MALKWEDTAYKNPLARAKGLGAAHAGLHHWMHQRVTAVANIFLGAWAIWSVLTIVAAGADYGIIRGFFAQPCNAILMILFLLSSFYHAALGLQVVIEDYVHCSKLRMLSLIGLNLGMFALCLASVFSVLKLAL